MTNQLKVMARKLLGIDDVFESAKINSALLQQIIEEQRRLRLLISEQFAQKSPITFEAMDAIQQETRDRLDVVIMACSSMESAFNRSYR